MSCLNHASKSVRGNLEIALRVTFCSEDLSLKTNPYTFNGHDPATASGRLGGVVRSLLMCGIAKATGASRGTAVPPKINTPPLRGLPPGE